MLRLPRRSLFVDLMVPVALAGVLLVAALTGAYAVYSLELVRVDEDRQAQQGLSTIADLIDDDERAVAGAARALVDTRGVADALAGSSPAGLRAELVNAQVNQDLDLALLVDAGRRQLVAVNVPPDLLARTRTVETAMLLLDASATEWIGDELWLLAAAVHRRSDGIKDGVVVVGRRIDERVLHDLSHAANGTVALEVAGRTVGPADVPGTLRATRTIRTMSGGEIGVVLFETTGEANAAALRSVQLVAGTGVLTLLVFVVFSIVVVRRATSPLRSLATAAAAVAAGERTRLAPTGGPRDVAETGRAFNQMVAAVAERERELERMNAATAEAAKQLEHLALHDGLTSLPNRALLHDRLSRAIGEAHRSGGQTSLVLLDLDNFKEVNDTHGHAVGDGLLRRLALAFGSLLRETDTVARLGGDEFAIVLPGLDATGAVALVERVHRALDAAYTVADITLYAAASMGIAVYPTHGSDAETLLKRADQAMYMAKRAGGGTHVVFSEEQMNDDGARRALVADLRRAIHDDAITLHYQPIVSLGSGALVAVEGLARWRHASRGWIPPAEFVPLAEQHGLISQLTWSVLRVALRDHAALRRHGIAVPVAVNLSMRTLLDPGLVAKVRELLEEADADPRALHLEITESAIMADPERAVRTVAELRALGIQLAIDDFGTGYSSLAYLNRLVVHTVKVDRSFVGRALDDENSAVIVRATVDLGHALGFEVVAEGVEERATLAFLRRLGCDYAQGYDIGRPMPCGDLAGWLAAREGGAPAPAIA